MSRPLAVALLALAMSGCANLYTHVDTAPNSTDPLSFRGIEDYLRDGRTLHVMQVHGMGEHSFENDCDVGSENLKLQEAIADRLGYVRSDDYPRPKAETIDLHGTKAGTFSVSKFVDPSARHGQLLFSCVTWGETGRILKQGILELDDQFLETNENERHRAPVNRAAKRFVNRSFSDPVIYLGNMGPYIRSVVWKGIQESVVRHVQFQSTVSLASTDTPAFQKGLDGFFHEGATAIISDSLGSRIVFDVLCSVGGADCQGADRLELAAERERNASQLARNAALDELLVRRLGVSIHSVYMLANQLPLLELAYVEPPTDGTSLEDMIAGTTQCFGPLIGTKHVLTDTSALSKNRGNVQIVAFTDVNDALSYHLTDAFKERCASAGNTAGAIGAATQGAAPSQEPESGSKALEIINVTLPNSRLRWFFAYSDLAKAHSSGFKENDRAIDYLVHGND